MTASDGTVGVAFIGCGSVMQGAYLPRARHLERLGRVRVIGACDRTTRRSDALLALGIDRFTVDVDELVGWDDVDVIVVATPIATHVDLAAAALQAGHHVLLEKPMAASLADARRLQAVAAGCTGMLMVAPAVTLTDTFARIRAHLDDGDIGTVSLARTMYGWAGPDWSEWFYAADGGPLRDLGVYGITSLTGLMGPALSVMAMGGVTQPERVVNGSTVPSLIDDHVQLLLEFEAGAIGVVTSGFTVQQANIPSLEIYGTSGTVQLLGHDWAPKGYELWTNDTGCWRRYPDREPGWPWTSGLDHVVDAARGAKKVSSTIDHAVHVTEIIEAALRSTADGRRHSLVTSFERPPAEVIGDSSAHRRHDPTRHD